MNQQEAMRICQRETQRILQNTGISPSVLVNYGVMAQQAVNNPSIKQQLYQDAVNKNIISQAEYPNGLKTDDLAMFIVMGKIASKMIGGK